MNQSVILIISNQLFIINHLLIINQSLIKPIAFLVAFDRWTLEVFVDLMPILKSCLDDSWPGSLGSFATAEPDPVRQHRAASAIGKDQP